MDSALSIQEMQLVTDPSVMLAKNRIIRCVYSLFESMAEEYKKVLNEQGMHIENRGNAKIARGENYQGLPYVMLDFPRNFTKENTFAIRTFFWWGHFFSITLQLQGLNQQQHALAIETAIANSDFNGWYIAISQNQWEHNVDAGDYSLVNDKKIYNISALPFLKLAKKIPLTKWDEAYTFLFENFTVLIKTLAD